MDHIPGCQGNSPGLHPPFDHPRISCPGKGMSHTPNPYSDGSCLFDSLDLLFPDQNEVVKNVAICAVSISLLKIFCKCSVLYIVCK